MELSEEEASALDRRAGNPAARTSAAVPSDHVVAGSFIGWNVVDESTIDLVTGEDGLVQVVTLDKPCPGLKSAETVLFVTSTTGSTNVYDSILLDDGTRCYFSAVSPQFR